MDRETQLLERGEELAKLEGVLAAARDGDGAVLVLEGEAGIGKTRLLDAARQRAAEMGLLVLAARGGELEREFSYGVVRQLFEPLLDETPPQARDELLGAAAAPAGAVLGIEGATAPSGPDAGFLIHHALYWLTVNLASARPVLLVLDDAQWADRPSWEALLHLARRLEGVAAAVVLGWRTGEPGAPEDLLDALRQQPHVSALSPQPLSADASAVIVRRALGAGADVDFCEACRETSGGNPFLLGELVETLARDKVPPTTDQVGRVRSLSPSAVSRSVLVRLARLPPDAATLARAVAVLENDADAPLAAALAGLEEPAATQAAEQLVAARVLSPSEPLRFSHPILRTAVYEDLAAPSRSALHRRAAHLLAARRRPDRAAGHFMGTEPAGDDRVVAALRAAAGRALERGASGGAELLLQRALEEPPPDRDRGAVLLELGRAERMSGSATAVAHLEAALSLAADDGARERVARELGLALLMSGRAAYAVAMFDAVIGDVAPDDRERRLRLEIEANVVAINALGLNRRVADRLATLAREALGETPAERQLLAAYAFQCVLGQSLARAELDRLIDRAWAGGKLLEDSGPESMAVGLLVLALSSVDRLQEAGDLCDRQVASALAHGSVVWRSGALANRGRVALGHGELPRAESDLSEAVHLASLSGSSLFRYWALSQLAITLVYRGRLAESERLLASHGVLEGDLPQTDIQSNVLLLARAHLHAAAGQWGRARRDADTFAARLETLGMHPSGLPAPRLVPLARLLDGDRPAARRYAEDRVAAARRVGVAGAVGAALNGLALVKEERVDVELLTEAVESLERSPRRIELVEALTDLGSALRRANRRVEGREPLRRALDLAEHCGARLLAERAHQELRACGAKPRRLVVHGADSLTASERRVAEIAAAGATNREIAQRLFVTPKTVETHLRAVYRKLDVPGRAQLADALAPAAPTPPAPVATVTAEPDDAALATVLLTDIVGSSERAAQLGDRRWRQLLDRHDALVRGELQRHRGREVKHTGDGFLATFDSATRAVRCACSIRERLHDIGVEVRAGLHTGECSVDEGDLRGLAVHASARILAAAEPGEVLVSGTVRDIAVPAGWTYAPSRSQELAGIPGEWSLHPVVSA